MSNGHSMYIVIYKAEIAWWYLPSLLKIQFLKYQSINLGATFRFRIIVESYILVFGSIIPFVKVFWLTVLS